MKTGQRPAAAMRTVHPSLPGPDYHGPEVYEVEKERIFYRSWFCVGRQEQLAEPGDYVLRDVGDESVIVVRTKGSELRAFYNVCRHRGSRLCDDPTGHVKGVITCPYHAWSYTLEGDLVGTPNVHEQDGLDREKFGLWGIAVDSWDGFVFVNLSPEHATLQDALRNEPDDPLAYARYAMGDLRIGHRIDYDVAANWKVILENFNECLHCPSVHPELVKIVPMYRKGIVETNVGEIGNALIEGGTSFTRTGRSNLPTLPGITEQDRHLYYGFVIFPNLIINLHSDCAMIYEVFPRGPDRTIVVSEYLFRPETIAAPGFDPGDVVEFWDLVSSQDWVVCERVQRGVKSRAFSAGVYPPQDRLLWEFSKRYLAERGPMA